MTFAQPGPPLPWGLSQMKPFRSTIEIPPGELVLNPASQVVERIGLDGRIVESAPHGTSTGRETGTSTAPSDGQLPPRPDQDHDQTPDND